ncbi:MAG: 16S rRNA (uracil(1498)-N(3))-methyltransferase [Microthrixaceae bacterium]
MSPEQRPWRSAAALVYVDDLDADELGREDDHHLRRVLRLRPGDELCLCDGSGSIRPAVLADQGRLDLAGDVERVAPPPYPITVGVAPPKGDRLDLLVAKTCELGVDRIVLFAAERSVVRWDAGRTERALERLGRVVRAAGAQSRRTHLPELAIEDLGALLAAGAPIADLDGRPPASGDRTLLVGPEGGWSDEERAAADAGGGRVRLAADVLRVETAAIASAVALGLARPA